MHILHMERLNYYRES